MPEPRPKGCPPEDTQPVDQTFFRFVSRDTAPGERPPVSDWLYPYEQPKSPHFGDTETCRCHAHSIIADLQGVEQARSLIPIFKKKAVATVHVTPDQGVVKHTPAKMAESHHSWWPDPIDLWPEAVVT